METHSSLVIDLVRSAIEYHVSQRPSHGRPGLLPEVAQQEPNKTKSQVGGLGIPINLLVSRAERWSRGPWCPWWCYRTCPTSTSNNQPPGGWGRQLEVGDIQAQPIAMPALMPASSPASLWPSLVCDGGGGGVFCRMMKNSFGFVFSCGQRCGLSNHLGFAICGTQCVHTCVGVRVHACV